MLRSIDGAKSHTGRTFAFESIAIEPMSSWTCQPVLGSWMRRALSCSGGFVLAAECQTKVTLSKSPFWMEYLWTWLTSLPNSLKISDSIFVGEIRLSAKLPEQMLVLDFDLDFIVRPIRQAPPDKTPRYDIPEITIWPEHKFCTFLEERLHLSKSEKVPGRACEHHKEVFYQTRALIAAGVLVPPLELVHIDAHDDIVGCSDAGPMSSADFLLHMIAKEWLAKIDFVLPEGEDFFRFCLMRENPLRIEFGSHQCPIHYSEPASYQLPRKPDFVFLTRSPDFTPPAADPLFDLAKTYILE
jgi:hypothetical protein